MDKRVYTIVAEIPNAEVRAAEIIEDSFTTKDGKTIDVKYIDIKVDDEDANRIYLKDKNLDNIDLYKRGAVGTFKILIDVEEDFGKKFKILVKDFIVKE